ncbi:hypothetical protein SAMN05421505_11963 [Sinosporangium album]|uniref:Serine peptidase n=1 Tax=Sinosporangium album TaxID=504805 RepID=A0A1G8E054_9ACTN|nr:hypothetical protein [Sinosporangium album]SDH63274.1 hypothetical protein SAMN05421505_11963 [Sinosporangium album]
MSAIVGVHGIGKHKYYEEAGRSPEGAAEAMRLKWDRYLHAGLTGGSAHSGQSYITTVAYYAHLLNDGPAGNAPMRAAAPQPMDQKAQAVLVEWAAQVDALKNAVGESLTGSLRRLTEWLLTRLDHRAAAFAGLFAPEVSAYLDGRQGARAACASEVAETIRREKARVVIAHSLGSVVAYEALWANPDLEVDLLITLGSPLGLRRVVFDRLTPAPVKGRGQRPKGVARWVNIADKDDIAAIPPALAALFGGVDLDIQVNLDWIDFHTVEKYLGSGRLNPHLQPYLL